LGAAHGIGATLLPGLTDGRPSSPASARPPAASRATPVLASLIRGDGPFAVIARSGQRLRLA
jgi:hypothetical protein